MRRSKLDWIALALAAAGVCVAGYLTYVHYAELSPVCAGGGGGCARVQASEYAKVLGVPVAVIGLAGYLAIFVACVGRSERARAVAAALCLGAAAFSIYLTYLELWVIEAICQWCVGSAVIALALAGVSGARYVIGSPRALSGQAKELPES